MQTFQFGMPDQRYEEHPFDMRRGTGALPSSSRSSSSSEVEKSVPRKRSFSANPRAGPITLSTNIEEGSTGPPGHTINTINMYTPTSFRSMQVDSAPGNGAYEDMDVGGSGANFLAASANSTANGSPIDGNNGGVSPIEGGGSGCVSGDDDGGDGDDIEGEREDQLKPLDGMGVGGMSGGGAGGMDSMGMGILGGKAPGTNNFVAKLYQ